MRRRPLPGLDDSNVAANHREHGGVRVLERLQVRARLGHDVEHGLTVLLGHDQGEPVQAGILGVQDRLPTFREPPSHLRQQPPAGRPRVEDRHGLAQLHWPVSGVA
jgi:hypothetical protein